MVNSKRTQIDFYSFDFQRLIIHHSIKTNYVLQTWHCYRFEHDTVVQLPLKHVNFLWLIV